jgi:hypothetical protein
MRGPAPWSEPCPWCATPGWGTPSAHGGLAPVWRMLMIHPYRRCCIPEIASRQRRIGANTLRAKSARQALSVCSRNGRVRTVGKAAHIVFIRPKTVIRPGTTIAMVKDPDSNIVAFVERSACRRSPSGASPQPGRAASRSVRRQRRASCRHARRSGKRRVVCSGAHGGCWGLPCPVKD